MKIWRAMITPAPKDMAYDRTMNIYNLQMNIYLTEPCTCIYIAFSFYICKYISMYARNVISGFMLKVFNKTVLDVHMQIAQHIN